MEIVERIVRMKNVPEIVGLGLTRIYDLEKAGKFPRRRKISERSAGYLMSELQDWVRSRPVVEGCATGESQASAQSRKTQRHKG